MNLAASTSPIHSGPGPLEHSRPRRPRNEASEVTAALGGALFGIALSDQLPGGIVLGVVLGAAFAAVGWYAAYRANKTRQ